MHVLVTDQIKNARSARVAEIFLPLKSMVIIPDAQGQLTPHSVGHCVENWAPVCIFCKSEFLSIFN